MRISRINITTTMMSDLFPNFGNQTMKFIEIFLQITWRIGSDWSVPGALAIPALLH
jgi:hypothetical protein